MSVTISPADLRFIAATLSSRAGGDGSSPDGLDAPVSLQSATPSTRAAELGAIVFTRIPKAPLRRAIALTAMACQLRLDGYMLLAPQGVVVGMVGGLDTGRVSASAVARWIEDRAIPG